MFFHQRIIVFDRILLSTAILIKKLKFDKHNLGQKEHTNVLCTGSGAMLGNTPGCVDLTAPVSTKN